MCEGKSYKRRSGNRGSPKGWRDIVHHEDGKIMVRTLHDVKGSTSLEKNTNLILIHHKGDVKSL